MHTQCALVRTERCLYCVFIRFVYCFDASVSFLLASQILTDIAFAKSFYALSKQLKKINNIDLHCNLHTVAFFLLLLWFLPAFLITVAIFQLVVSPNVQHFKRPRKKPTHTHEKDMEMLQLSLVLHAKNQTRNSSYSVAIYFYFNFLFFFLVLVYWLQIECIHYEKDAAAIKMIKWSINVH